MLPRDAGQECDLKLAQLGPNASCGVAGQQNLAVSIHWGVPFQGPYMGDRFLGDDLLRGPGYLVTSYFLSVHVSHV